MQSRDLRVLLPRVFLVGALLTCALEGAAQTTDLATSKQLIEPVPGSPQRLNSLPMSMAVSPDGRYVVTVNAGYGTFESGYKQSLAVLDTTTGTLRDFPDDRTLARMAKQTLFSGLAFSGDGSHLYASMGSVTDPAGRGPGATGSGVIVYRFAAGGITPERFIRLPIQDLAPGRRSRLLDHREGSQAVPFPAALALVPAPGGERLLVAGNLSDDVLLLDPASGAIEHRFDLSGNDAVPSTFPGALALSKDGRRAFVALWNASEIVELDLEHSRVGRRLALLKPSSPVAPGTHPAAFALSPDGGTLYVALANRDAVAAVGVGGDRLALEGFLDTRLPGQRFFGAEPVALALNADGSRLYAANMGSDAIAVFDPRRLGARAAQTGAGGGRMLRAEGFVPTEWLPFAMTSAGSRLYVATAKGRGAGPNNMPQAETPEMRAIRYHSDRSYIGTLLHGSLASIDTAEIEKNLPAWTAAALESNRMRAAAEKIAFAGAGESPIRHVIYIIKENRTYDQVLGDLRQEGRPVGNGDPRLTMYGEQVTPNIHKLALQFGVLDNFEDSGEVSGDGHVWSNAAIGSDYLEKTWQQSYRGAERPYDYEGVVAGNYPLLQGIPDVNEPASGYLWGDLAAHGKSYYHFGEFISTIFCDQPEAADPQVGPMLRGRSCDRRAIAPGEELPAEWGGGVNRWPWPIPRIAANTATKPELQGHFAAEAPDFNLMIPDQVRVEIFLRHLAGWRADRESGKDTMPNFISLRLGNDHTAGTRPGGPTPKASVADNDLAVGRVVEAISHSPFWDDTALFILEDDAQDGADHVDAHRSYALVVSKYAPHGPGGRAFVDGRFYTTVSVVRTMEALLGLPPMNNNDALSPLIASLFAGPGDQPPFTADASNRDNQLIYTANGRNAPGATESMKMDFRHADQADSTRLNVILWRDAMGDRAVPAMLTHPHASARRDQDDDDR